MGSAPDRFLERAAKFPKVRTARAVKIVAELGRDEAKDPVGAGLFRFWRGGLARFGNQSLEARVAVQGFQVGVGGHLFRSIVSVSDGLA